MKSDAPDRRRVDTGLQRPGPKVREEELIGEIDEIPKYRVFKRTCTCMQTVK